MHFFAMNLKFQEKRTPSGKKKEPGTQEKKITHPHTKHTYIGTIIITHTPHTYIDTIINNKNGKKLTAMKEANRRRKKRKLDLK